MKLLSKFILIAFVTCACVERIEFDARAPQQLIVIDGRISDSAPPYSVRLSRGVPLGVDSIVSSPIEGATITLYDDLGNSEPFLETSPGNYLTGGAIQGAIGRSYSIRVTTPSGTTFQSEAERIQPVGEIENIRYEYEARTIMKSFGEVEANVFNIFVDANSGPNPEAYVRWRFTGTYKVVTYPALHSTWNPPYTPYRNPFPCSGYILAPGPEGSGGLLVQVDDCTCCTCYAKHFETKPQLSDTQLIQGNQFKNIKVGEVPITNATFHEKYMVEVEQMSLSENAFNFFKLIRDQKENASSIFQPPSSEIRSNFSSDNSDERVAGFFWAAAITKKVIFIYPEAVPYTVISIYSSTYPCYDVYENASTQKPIQWD